MPNDEVDAVQTKPALPAWANKQLDELHARLMLRAAYRRIHEELLTEEERTLLRDAPDEVRDIIGFWAKSRKKSYVAAMLELGHLTNLLAQGDRDNLAALLGETVFVPAGAKPHWDRETVTLHFRGQMVRRFRGRTTAKNQVAVLDAFEEEGWPSRIDDPLSPSSKGRRLREVVRKLNKGQTILRFSADGSSQGITWRAV